MVGETGVRRLETGGPIVGLFDGAPFEEGSVRLARGEWVIVYSDGVSEARSSSDEEFGDPRLIEVVRGNLQQSPAGMLEAILGAVRKFTEGAPQSDDVTALVVRYLGA